MLILRTSCLARANNHQDVINFEAASRHGGVLKNMRETKAGVCDWWQRATTYESDWNVEAGYCLAT